MRDQQYITLADQYVIDFVKKIRIEKGLTQEDIANIIGLSRSFIKDVESINNRAKYNIRHINALADYFGISPREFLPEKAFPVDAPDREKKTIRKSIVKKKVVSKRKK